MEKEKNKKLKESKNMLSICRYIKIEITSPPTYVYHHIFHYTDFFCIK